MPSDLAIVREWVGSEPCDNDARSAVSVHGTAERARAGLMPMAGLDLTLEEAQAMPRASATATVEALSALISSGNPLFKNGELWTPHRPARPDERIPVTLLETEENNA